MISIPIIFINIYNIVGTTASIISLIMSVFILFRVSSIEKAKKVERGIITKFLQIKPLMDTIDDITIRWASDIQKPELVDASIKKLTNIKGEIEGALRVIMQEESFWDKKEMQVRLIKEDYFTEEFILSNIKKARKRIICACFRNFRILSISSLDAIIDKIKANDSFNIQIIALSSDISEETYDLLCKLGSHYTITNYKEDVNKNINEAKQMIIDKKLVKSEADRIEYYESKIPPFFHCLIVDDTVYYGLNFIMQNDYEMSELLRRACIVDTCESVFGEKVNEQFEILKSLSSRVSLFEESTLNTDSVEKQVLIEE